MLRVLLRVSSATLLSLVDTRSTAESNHATLVHLSSVSPPHVYVLARFCAPALLSPCWCTVTDRCQDWPWPYRAQKGHAAILQAQGPRTGCLARTPSGLPTRKPARARSEEDCRGGGNACRLRRKDANERKMRRGIYELGEEEMRQVAALESLQTPWSWIEMHRKRRLREQAEC